MVKLIAIDMDGTLLDNKKVITKGNEDAIKNAKSKGTHIVIATGRPRNGIKRYSEQLDVEGSSDYQILFNGAIVYDNKKDEIISSKLLSGEDLFYLYRLSKDLGVNIHAFNEHQDCITPKLTKYSELEGTINKIGVEVINYDQVIQPSDKIIKVMFIDEPSVLENAIHHLPNEVYKRYSIVRSAPYFLEFLNKKADKWTALNSLADYLGIANSEVMTIGDAGNDLEMVKNAGIGVAMENGFKEVLNSAKFITKNNNEDGVAYAINKFI